VLGADEVLWPAELLSDAASPLTWWSKYRMRATTINVATVVTYARSLARPGKAEAMKLVSTPTASKPR
jgi:hypothetical protein